MDAEGDAQGEDDMSCRSSEGAARRIAKDVADEPVVRYGATVLFNMIEMNGEQVACNCARLFSCLFLCPSYALSATDDGDSISRVV